MKKEVLDYLRSIEGQPITLGKTDCNSITAAILDIIHGTNIQQRLTNNITREKIRNFRASQVLEEIGYKVVTERPKTGDFIVVPEKRFDSCMFLYAPNQVISSFAKMRQRKVRTMRLEIIGNNSKIYRFQND